MNTPPSDLIGNWSAELTGHEHWRDLGGTFDYWWEAALALIDEEVDEFKIDAPDARDADDEIVLHNREIDVGIFTQPTPPEEYIFGSSLIDIMREIEDDDYILEGCGCEDFLSNVTKQQEDELEDAVRAAVAAWLDKHDLRPKWKVVGQRWTVTAGMARAANQIPTP